MISVKDVAQLAGVGVGTVSRVINNHPSVKAENRERVMAAIQQLQYVPNEVARNFKMQKSNIVALMLPTIWHPLFSELAYYIEDELDRHDYKLILCNSKGKPKKELYYFDTLNKNKVAGIIALTYNNLEHNVLKEIPVVSIDRHLNDEISFVTSDNYAGGQMALNRLIEAGAGKTAFLGVAWSLSVNSEVGLRKQGFIDEAEKKGILHTIHEIPDEGDDKLDFSLDKFITSEEHKSIDGIFINGDLLAERYIKRASIYRIRVPEDVKIIGYDGIRNYEYSQPVLSTIRQPVEQMARTSVQILLRKIEDEMTEMEVYRLPVEFKKGETT